MSSFQEAILKAEYQGEQVEIDKPRRLSGGNKKFEVFVMVGDVAPHDLREIAGFLRNLNGANIDVSNHPETVRDLMDIAELEYDPELGIQQNIQETE